MRNYIIRKLCISILIMVGVVTGTFMLLYLSADPVATLLPPEATEQDIEKFRTDMGLNDPIITQWLRFLWQVARFDFGESYINKQPVTVLMLERLPATAELTFAAFVFSLSISLTLGIVSAIKRFSWIDNLSTFLALMGQAMPIYWLGIMLIIFFGVKLQILPISGKGGFLHLILPAITLGTALAPIVMRMTRSAMSDVLNQDYIRTARANGLSNTTIYFKHAIKNAILPVIAIIFVQIGSLLSGAVVTETVFAWPGLGRLATTAILASDYPMVRALVIMFTIFVVIANLLGDIIIAHLDPRIRIK
ncbi:MAG: ABC transporter permease [Deltaproteobacteria bacterium]|nr:ABC transporter permease [Deltaproteobacteria bacterium]MBW2153698.1 ABC transporter permease [Deltaproteobacteria bacterium]